MLQKEATTLLACFLIQDYQSIDVVHSQAFRSFVHGIAPWHRIPCDATIISRINLMFSELLDTLKIMLARAAKIAVTTDIHSTGSIQILGVTAHNFLAEKSCSTVVAGIPFHETHTAGNIISVLNKVFLELSIQKKITWITSDSGSNFVSATNQMIEKNLNALACTVCFSHSMNTIVRAGFSSHNEHPNDSYKESIRTLRNVVVRISKGILYITNSVMSPLM